MFMNSLIKYLLNESEAEFANMASLCIVACNGQVSVILMDIFRKYIPYSLPTYKTTQEDISSETRDQLPPEFPILAAHTY